MSDKDFSNGFMALEKLHMFCEEHGELMALAIETAKDMDADQHNLHKAGTFHGVCLAISTATGVDISLVEETMCDFADVSY